MKHVIVFLLLLSTLCSGVLSLSLARDTCVISDEEDCGMGSMTSRTKVYPGGNTSCIENDPNNPFYFVVSPGRNEDANNLHLYFDQGGACFNYSDCLQAMQLNTALKTPLYFPSGIFDTNNQRNPFRDWTTVSIGYCTGDIHIGAGVTGNGRVHFNGRNNVKSALAWVDENVPTPDRVLVSGCSAGSFGLQFWAKALTQKFKSISPPPVLHSSLTAT